MKENIQRLVIDANIFFSALVKDSVTRKLIIELPAYLYTPDILIDEITAHLKTISAKNGLTVTENKKILEKLSTYVTIIEYGEYKPWLKKAHTIMKNTDPSDTPYLALALSFKNDGIWTDDKDFEKQKEARIWKTKDILKLI